MFTALLIGGLALLILRKAKKQQVEGIGKIKRRVYAEMESLQRAGVPLDATWNTLTSGEQNAVTTIAKRYAYKQPASSTKSYGEAYYNSIRRQYAAVAGTTLPYTESVVYNENGDEIIRYRDYGTDEDKKRRAFAWFEDEAIAHSNGGYDDAYRAAILYIADGGKFVWSKNPGGVLQEVFATGTNAAGERKARISYLASESKGGKTVLTVAHSIFEHYGIDDQEARNAICDVIREFESKGAVQKYIMDLYTDAHTNVQDTDLPF